MKKNLNAIVFALAIVIASIILGNAVINRNQKTGTISVTGLGKTDFRPGWERMNAYIDCDIIIINFGYFNVLRLINFKMEFFIIN